MTTIIVFSKDRPMQLHAYLESLIKASGCRQQQIYVLYKEAFPICYDKVRSFFPDIIWVAEDGFINQLRDIVSKADEYVMFGCDDVVFTDYFSLQRTELLLKENEDIFGFSFRLGKNIRPIPKNIEKKEDMFIWNWTENTWHYGYPWELDCTLYRKTDVIKIINKAGDVKSPNYLESIPEDDPAGYIERKKMAAYYDNGKAVVITVNRVQDTHLNGIDDAGQTDILSLFIKYQYEDRYLDLEKIWNCKTDKIHVGNEYFILSASVTQNTHDNTDKKISKWRYLIQNARYLAGGNLRTQLIDQERDSMIRACFRSMTSGSRKSKVLSPEETVQLLTDSPKSFCRFGDGEFMLMLGSGIGFQEYDPKLALALWEIFSTSNQDLYVGVPYQQFESPDGFNPSIREFYYTSGQWIRRFLYKYLPNDRELYIDTGFNQVYQTYAYFHFADYYKKIKSLFSGKNITIISGQDILKGMDHDIFADAASVEHIHGPKKNAFMEYDSILEQAMQVEKNRLICAILGPTSKILVRDLTRVGYTAWDIGHLVKDYNAWCKRLGREREDIAKFYAAD